MRVTDDNKTTVLGLKGQWLETAPGEQTFYHDLGAGVPLTLLHGSGPGVCAAANWWLNVGPLSAGHRVIALDLLGFGQTRPAAGSRYGIDAWGDQTLRLLDGLGVEKTWLVGNSLGGWVALQLGIDHPDRISGIISMGTGGAARPPAVPAARGEYAAQGRMSGALSAYVFNQDLVTDELARVRAWLAERPGAADRFNAARAARDHDREHHPLDPDALARLDLPVLLIHGREDAIIPLRRSWDLVNVIPRADLIVMSHCGHWSQIDRAEQFNRQVSEFVHGH
jgi:2-hydroxymuconate-semialdehyde hydrolase